MSDTQICLFTLQVYSTDFFSLFRYSERVLSHMDVWYKSKQTGDVTPGLLVCFFFLIIWLQHIRLFGWLFLTICSSVPATVPVGVRGWGLTLPYHGRAPLCKRERDR